MKKLMLLLTAVLGVIALVFILDGAEPRSAAALTPGSGPPAVAVGAEESLSLPRVASATTMDELKVAGVEGDEPPVPSRPSPVSRTVRSECDVVSVAGRVIDESDGSGVVGASVIVEFDSWSSPPRQRVTRTTGDGSFSLDLGAGETAWARITAPEHAGQRVMLYDGERAPEEELVVRLQRTATLVLEVRDDAGLPLVDVTAKLATRIAALDPSWLDRSPQALGGGWKERTNARGDCSFTGVSPAMPLDLELDCTPSFAHGPFVLDPGEKRRVTIRVHDGISLTGKLLDESNEPVSGSRVWLVRADEDATGALSRWDQPVSEVWVEEDGFFAFGGVRPGLWRVGARPSQGPSLRGHVAPLATVVEVLPDSPDLHVIVRTHRGLFVTGRVVDPDGEPLHGVPVIARGEGGDTMESSGRDGSFRLGPLGPEDCDLVAWTRYGTETLAPGETVRVRAGARGVVLELRRAGGIRWRLLAPDGGAARSRAVLTCGRPELHWRIEAFAEPEVKGLVPGTYGLSASTYDGLVAVASGIVVVAGRVTDVELPLEPGTRLAVRRGGEGGTGTLLIRSGGVVVVADSLEAGATRTFVVPIGPLVVELREGDEREEVEIVARRDELNRAVLE